MSLDYLDGVKAVGSQESMLTIQECPDIESGSDLLLKGASELVDKNWQLNNINSGFTGLFCDEKADLVI